MDWRGWYADGERRQPSTFRRIRFFTRPPVPVAKEKEADDDDDVDDDVEEAGAARIGACKSTDLDAAVMLPCVSYRARSIYDDE